MHVSSLLWYWVCLSRDQGLLYFLPFVCAEWCDAYAEKQVEGVPKSVRGNKKLLNTTPIGSCPGGDYLMASPLGERIEEDPLD